MGFDADEMKRLVSVEKVLNHYGSLQDKRGRWRCLFPERHKNADAAGDKAELEAKLCEVALP